jgi:hypothetical protein
MKEHKMFKNEDDLKNIIDRLNIDDKPDDTHRQNLRRKMLSVFNESMQKTARTKGPRHIQWRTIMKSKITKLAAAAVIIIAVTLGLTTILDKSITTAYAIEQTIEALNSVRTVHIVARGWDNEPLDAWMKINHETGKADYTYLKMHFMYNGDTFEFIVVSTPEISYQYNVTKNIVEVFERQLIQTGFEFDRIFESIVENLDKNQKVEVYQGKTPESAKDIIVLLVQSEDKTTKFLIDPDTKLPISIETFGSGGKTDLKRTEKISYNESVPEGIFDFEIPENAKVVNISDIEQKLDTPNAGIPVDNLTKKEASVLVTKEYWLALINKDWVRVEKLRPIHSATEWSKMKSDNPPIELLEVGQAYWEKGCSEPVTLCTVKYKDGRILEIKTYPRFRENNGEQTCVIGGIYGQSSN